MSEAELAARLPRFRADLEHLPFTIAFAPAGDGRARHDFCFRVPGKVIAALEELALGRSFGGNPGQVEMALLQGLALRAGGTASLRLVMQQGAPGWCRANVAAGGRSPSWRRTGAIRVSARSCRSAPCSASAGAKAGGGFR